MNRVLTIAPIAIGDSVVFNPLLKTLAASVPGVHVTLLGARSLGPLYRLFPGVDAVIDVDDAAFYSENGSSPLRTSTEIGAFDTVVDILCTPACRHLVRSLKAAVKIGMDYSENGDHPYTIVLPRFSAVESRSAVDMYLDFARALQLRCPSHDTTLDLGRLPPPSSAETRALVMRLAGTDPIALLLAGGDWHKHYPPELVTELIRTSPDPAPPIVVVFGPGERPAYGPHLAAWRHASRGDLHVCSGPITDVIHVLRECSATIGNDCGFMHIAVAMGLPTVALFGPSQPATWFPYTGRLKHRYLVATVPCRPCYGDARAACARNCCMEEFTASSIWTTFLRLR